MTRTIPGTEPAVVPIECPCIDCAGRRAEAQLKAMQQNAFYADEPVIEGSNFFRGAMYALLFMGVGAALMYLGFIFGGMLIEWVRQ